MCAWFHVNNELILDKILYVLFHVTKYFNINFGSKIDFELKNNFYFRLENLY